MIAPVVTSDPSAVASSLSFGEREEISCRRASGEGVRVIARALGRSAGGEPGVVTGHCSPQDWLPGVGDSRASGYPGPPAESVAFSSQ